MTFMNMSPETLQTLVWMIPAPPLVAFFVILLFTRGSKVISDLVAVAAILLTWVMAILVFIAAVTRPDLGQQPITASLQWLPIGGSSATSLSMGVLIDPLGALMLFFVPLTATMIFIYSTGYMASGHYWTEVKGEEDAHGHGDEHAAHGHDEHAVEIDSAGRKLKQIDATTWKARFMAYIALFAGAMLILSLADNLLLLFVGWEIMGVCSYLLIGFWTNKVYPNQPKRITPVGAGIKAFMTTRVGDMFMLLGIAWLYSYTGTLSFRAILYNADVLASLKAAAFPSIPALAGVSVAGAIGVLLVMGTVGKSAQFPLHTWLPDAMEGPTPVSAMIHAATMVSAGVYMIIRMFPLMSVGWVDGGALTLPMNLMATVGAFTALFAATIAMTQRDVKKVLAYSTISQLGYMVAAVGIGAYAAAAFHLMTHAIFKALLFMGSGSIIHSVEHGEEHAHHAGHHFPIDFDAQDMFNMGGLWSRIPVTAWTFLIGGLALSGFPLVTAGFWSKDEILAEALKNNMPVFVALAISAFLTAFYTIRQIGLTFAGQPRTEAAEEATQNDWRMNLPLVILAFFAIFAGYVGVSEGFPVLGHLLGDNFFHRFISQTLLEAPAALTFDWTPMIISIVIALSGLAVGWLVYVWHPLKAGQTDPLKRVLGPIYTLLENKYYFDELYDFLFVRPARWIAEVVIYQALDKTVIDGTLTGIARFFEWLGFRAKDADTFIINAGSDRFSHAFKEVGDSGKFVQSGRVQQYLAVGIAGLLVLAGVFAWALFR